MVFQNKKKVLGDNRMDKEKKKKRTSFRALTFAQIMTQRMQKSESGIVLKERDRRLKRRAGNDGR